MPRIPALLHGPTAAALSLSAFLVPAWLLSVVVELPEVSVEVQPDRSVTTLHASLATGTLAASEAGPEQDDPPAEEEAPAEAAEPAEAAPTEPPPAAAPPPVEPLLATTEGRPRPLPPEARRELVRERMKARRAARAEAEAEAQAEAVAKKQAQKRKKRNCVEGDNPDIAEVGAGSYRVARDLVDYYTDDLREAARLASVAWHQGEDGRVDGFRIRRIRCGSVLHEAGLRNGDVIHKVNGKPVRNIAQALSAYRKLRKKRKLWLDVTRKGEPVGLRYKLS